MMNRFTMRILKMALESETGEGLRERIRSGSIQAVKGYIHAIKFTRMGVMGLAGLAAVTALMVTGLVLMITAIVTMLPITTLAMSITLLVIGILLFGTAGFFLYGAFNEKRWLEMSKSYELMDAVLTPWDGMLPPNPLDVMANHPAAAHIRTEQEAPKPDPLERAVMNGPATSRAAAEPVPHTRTDYIPMSGMPTPVVP